jgi:hypothetical protein
MVDVMPLCALPVKGQPGCAGIGQAVQVTQREVVYLL